MSEVPGRNPCFFCKSTENKLTKQHVFAAQMAKHFEGVIGKKGTASIRTGNESPKTFPSAPFSDSIGGFCECCNNGWMNDIENEAISIVGEMMSRGLPRRLTPADQLALSSFAILTVLVLDHQAPNNRVVQESEYDAFYAKQTPSSNHLVWIGKTNPRVAGAIKSGEWVEGYLAQTRKGRVRPDRDGDNSDINSKLLRAAANNQWLYVFTFSIGFVAFQVMGHNLPTAVSLGLGAEHRSVFTEIWPVRSSVNWPPSDLIDRYGGVQGMQDVMTGSQAPEPPELAPPPGA
jgi:hypothetical protein